MSSEWIKSQEFGQEMSVLGEKVADLLGRVYLGIYHMSYSSLKKVDWSNESWIEVTIARSMSTVDDNMLTRLVVLCHDEMLRLEIRGVGPRYMKFAFSQRKGRTGELWSRCPTIEDAIEGIRKGYKELG